MSKSKYQIKSKFPNVKTQVLGFGLDLKFELGYLSFIWYLGFRLDLAFGL